MIIVALLDHKIVFDCSRLELSLVGGFKDERVMSEELSVKILGNTVSLNIKHIYFIYLRKRVFLGMYELHCVLNDICNYSRQ